MLMSCSRSTLEARVWHEAAVRRVQNYVRLGRYSSREILAVRLSYFAPNSESGKFLVMHNKRGSSYSSFSFRSGDRAEEMSS